MWQWFGYYAAVAGTVNAGDRLRSREGASPMTANQEAIRRVISAGVDRRTLLQTTGGALGLALLGRRAAAAQENGAQLVVGANFVIKSLDPARTIETTSNMIDHAVYESLVNFEGEDIGTPKPWLASEWSVSDDGKTYTF